MQLSTYTGAYSNPEPFTTPPFVAVLQHLRTQLAVSLRARPWCLSPHPPVRLQNSWHFYNRQPHWEFSHKVADWQQLPPCSESMNLYIMTRHHFLKEWYFHYTVKGLCRISMIAVHLQYRLAYCVLSILTTCCELVFVKSRCWFTFLLNFLDISWHYCPHTILQCTNIFVLLFVFK